MTLPQHPYHIQHLTIHSGLDPLFSASATLYHRKLVGVGQRSVGVCTASVTGNVRHLA
jgi:hypothetical protein